MLLSICLLSLSFMLANSWPDPPKYVFCLLLFILYILSFVCLTVILYLHFTYFIFIIFILALFVKLSWQMPTKYHLFVTHYYSSTSCKSWCKSPLLIFYRAKLVENFRDLDDRIFCFLDLSLELYWSPTI